MPAADGSGNNIPVISVNDDGSLNVNDSVPVPVGKRTSIWAIPQDVLNFEQDDKNHQGNPFWYDAQTQNIDNKAFSNRFLEANGSPTQTTTTDRYTNAESIMNDVMAMSYSNPLAFRDFQKALAAGPWGKVRVSNSMDPATEAALGKAMSQYIKLTGTGVAVTFMDFIYGHGSPLGLDGQPTTPGAAASGRQKIAPTLTLANPEDLRNAVQQAALTALGHGLKGDEVEKFVTAFQNQQRQLFDQGNNIAAGGGGGELTGLPSADTSALGFVKQEDPHGFAQHQVRGFADALLNDLLSGSPKEPDMNANMDQLAAS